MEAHTHQKLAVSLAALLLHDAGKEEHERDEGEQNVERSVDGR